MNLNLTKKIIKLFDNRDKPQLIFVFLLIFSASIIEMLGVASIMPFIGLLTDPEAFSNTKYFSYIQSIFSGSKMDIIVITGLLVITLFVLSNLINAFTFWQIVKFSAVQNHRISSLLMSKYLDQDYSYFIKSDVSNISRNILDESCVLSEGIVLPYLQVIAKSLIVVTISILLLLVDYKLFIASILFLLLIYFIIYKNIKALLQRNGAERLKENDKRFKNTHDAFNSIKDVKFYNIEKHYVNLFSNAANKYSFLTAKSILFSHLPKYMIEIVAFGGIFSLVLYLIAVDNSLIGNLPILSVFVLAAYRLLPSMQQIFANLTTIKFNMPVLELLENIIHLPGNEKNIKNNSLSFDKNIKFDDVTFGYEKNKSIIKNISFTINKGDFIGVVGSTGAGKTTIVDLLLGLYVPTQGAIYIDDKRIDNLDFNLKSLIGYVSQNISLVNDTIVKNIAFGINDNEIDYKLIKEVIGKSQLTDLVNKLDDGIMSSIGDKGVKLSGGQRQRIGIARALYFNPKVLVLDEATNELDVHTEEMIFNNIKEKNPDMTILMITHRLTSLKLCNEVLLLNKSKISRLEINNEDHLKKINNLIKLSYQNE
mgnify:FL=1|tara:strand:+ start:877 stop:2658 length:1782 start_codon:yes stop_codon:yes gene_type:complete